MRVSGSGRVTPLRASFNLTDKFFEFNSMAFSCSRHSFIAVRNSTSYFFSTTSHLPQPFSHQNSHYRKQIAVANLLKRYGFPPSQLHSFVSKNHFLLNSNLHNLEKSFNFLLSFNITQNSLVSLVKDCPAVLDFEFLNKWQLGVSQLRDLGLSSFVVRSFLELSKRFQIDPDRVFHTVKVFKALGFSDGVLRKILEGFPMVILMNEDQISMRIDFFRGIGFSREGIDRIVYFSPEVLGFGVENRLKPLLNEFWSWGFDEDLIMKEIVREPKFLSMELGELSRCLELLKSLKCREAIKERIFSDGAFRAGFEVKRRVDCLCKHGLIRREAFKILWMEPRVITYELDDIDEKIEFLVHRMKYEVSCLVEVPEYLGVNFQKQIIPRYDVIEYLRGKGGLAYEVGLKGLIRPSRLRFYNLYVKPYPECEKMFGRFSGGQAKSKHPAGMWKLFKPSSYTKSEDDVNNMKAFMETLV